MPNCYLVATSSITLMTAIAETPYWSAPKKIAVRFAFVFFILYALLEPNGVLPYTEIAYNLYIQPINKIVIWMGAHLLHLAKPVEFVQTGSGDTTHDYILYLLMLIAAAISAIVWSVVDRKARNYNKLFYWLTVIIRYYVAFTMISYGGIKIIKLQFASPTPDRLLQTYGNSSPMGLAWTYMGYSNGFNYFTGFGELTAGLLLLFRKTGTLGAVIGLVVSVNIMAVNYCFDVPVKLLSTMLVIMCLVLISKDLTRLVNFFFLNKTALPANLTPHAFTKRWKNITLTTIKYVLIIYVLAINAYGDVEGMSQYGDKAKKPPLYGVYNVETFVRNKDTIAPLNTDSTRWNKMTISYAGSARVRVMTDSSKRYSFSIDTVKRSIIMNTMADTVNKAYFTYSEPQKDILMLKGMFKSDSLQIRMKRYDMKKFLLLNRGFHWINEQAFNK